MKVPKPRIKRNGIPGEFELVWSSAEITFAGVLLSAVLGFGAFITVTQIALGREMSSTTERVKAVEKQSDANGAAIKSHDEWARDQRARLDKRIDDEVIDRLKDRRYR